MRDCEWCWFVYGYVRMMVICLWVCVSDVDWLLNGCISGDLYFIYDEDVLI